MKRLGLVAVLVAAGVSCGPAPNLLPVNDLNRPTDVAFMCFGAFAPGKTATSPDGGSATGSPDGGGVVDAAASDGAAADAGGSGVRVSGRPMRSCHPPGAYDPAPGAAHRTFAFMPDSASSGLTMVDADNWKLVDLDPATGGYGQATLGQFPEQISVSDDGCRLISANRGSCDLTVVDPSVLVAPVINRQDSQDAPVPLSRTASENGVRPIKADGTALVAAPYEAVFLPQDTQVLEGGDYLCGDPGALAQAGPVGWTTPGTPSPWYVLVTYPSCDLIVLMELPSRKIVQSVHARKNGKSVTFEDAGTSPVCRTNDCAGQSLPPADAAAGADSGAGGAAGGADAGADAGGSPDAAVLGAAVFPGIQFPDTPNIGFPLSPSSIAIAPGGGQVYVSLANASFVGSFGLTKSGLTLPGNAISLHEGAMGSKRIRLNVDPYAYGPPPASNALFSGKFVGTDPDVNYPNSVEDEYLYAIAGDGTLRVVNIFNPGAEQECETNADPLNLVSGMSAVTACIPVDPGHRRPFSVGPGIHFPTAPIDVAAADIDTPSADPNRQSEQSVYGSHAWVLTSTGVVYLVNIDPVLRMHEGPRQAEDYATPTAPNITEPPPFVNSLRDRNEITYSLTLDPSSGPPRVDVLPSVAASGPYIEPFWTQGAVLNATAQTKDYIETGILFPMEPITPSNQDDPVDRRGITPQSWTVTWEGALIGSRNTGRVPADPTDPLTAKAAALGPRVSIFADGGGNYCASGVLPGDMVTLIGCTVDAQCGLGEGCLVDTTVTTAAAGVPVTGLCVDPNRVSDETATCAAFLSSVRRYEIVLATPSELLIQPHLDELVRSGLAPCRPPDPDNPVNADCLDPNDQTTSKFTCETVYPSVGTGPRCLMKGCTKDIDCRIGRNCINFEGPSTPDACKDGHCFCADAPPLDTNGDAASALAARTCFDQLVAYQVNIGNGFLVAGSQSGFITTAGLRADGSCSLDPTPDSHFVFRIPMNAPHCKNVPDNSFDTRVDPDVVVGNLPQTQWTQYGNEMIANLQTLAPTDPDPCLYLGGPVGTEAQVDPTIATSDPTKSVVPGIPSHVRAFFHNAQITFVLANVDQQPSGQFQTGFDVHGGFAPQVVQDPTTVEVSMPARIVLGPVDSQSQTGGTMTPPINEQPYLFVVDQRRLGRAQGGGPTRGQLLRINPVGFTSSVGPATGLQPIFQDYTASGGIFPIQ